MIDDFINLLQKSKKMAGNKAKELASKLEALKETLYLNEDGPLPFEKRLLSIDKHTNGANQKHGVKHICVECFYQKVTLSNPGRTFNQNIDYFYLDLSEANAESFKCVFEGCDETTNLKTITDSFIKAHITS